MSSSSNHTRWYCSPVEVALKPRSTSNHGLMTYSFPYTCPLMPAHHGSRLEITIPKRLPPVAARQSVLSATRIDWAFLCGAFYRHESTSSCTVNSATFFRIRCSHLTPCYELWSKVHGPRCAEQLDEPKAFTNEQGEARIAVNCFSFKRTNTLSFRTKSIANGKAWLPVNQIIFSDRLYTGTTTIQGTRVYCRIFCLPSIGLSASYYMHCTKKSLFCPRSGISVPLIGPMYVKTVLSVSVRNGEWRSAEKAYTVKKVSIWPYTNLPASWSHWLAAAFSCASLQFNVSQHVKSAQLFHFSWENGIGFRTISTTIGLPVNL